SGGRLAAEAPVDSAPGGPGTRVRTGGSAPARARAIRVEAERRTTRNPAGRTMRASQAATKPPSEAEQSSCHARFRDGKYPVPGTEVATETGNRGRRLRSLRPKID